jgi:uncharacterized protein YndB with AHSA1/START domain
MSETLHVSDGLTTLRIERRLGHRPEKVWRAVTEPAHLNQWFPFDVDAELRVGGDIRFLDKSGDESGTTYGVVTDLDPPSLFAFTWGDDVLRIELSPDGEGSVLVFSHTFGDHYGAASFTAGWQTCLDGMEAILDGRPVTAPGGPADMAETHDAYVVAFGLDEGTDDETDDGGWRVRFERQMTRPGDVVWRALTGQADPVAGAPPPPGFTTDGVAAGPVTRVDEPKLLEYEWQRDGKNAGRVRWELGQGTGQGARLVLTQTGPAELADARAVAPKAWRARLDALAAELRRLPPSG